ncbi:MAG TPA: 2-oxoglutarate dehydrogenase E1 component [Spirochaetia bacterium]|nr:2-oxoglutarate dehydrogenase E1 component [Spirochaetia bacterium]
MERDSFLASNAQFVEELYRSWARDRSAVVEQWQSYFQKLEETGASRGEQDGGLAFKQSRVESLIWAYRDIGYLYAELNPLKGYLTPELDYLFKTIEGIYESLSLKEFRLSEEDLSTEFNSGKYMTPSRAPLAAILASLKEIYCGFIGAEILHIQNKPIRRWLIERIEKENNKPRLSREQKREVLEDLLMAEEFEHFIHSHYIGQKRFSLEGAEVLIPALHFLVNTATSTGIQEIVLGMSHRGRLDVLALIMGKPTAEIFATFEDNYHPHTYGGSGDVKYHLGYSLDHTHTDGSSVHISLVPNPSHLESVDPVVEGKARGVQKRRGDRNRKKVIPVLIHGDAAFTGQGVVAETFNLSHLKGYRTGGTLHIIVNNQIGFTTAARDARSTFFPTDVAKIMPVPILHVNGDKPEHVIRTMDLALKFRQKFGFDVVVDIFCYRRYGHNEADEPSFTHPIMYKAIKDHPGVASLYSRSLDEEGIYGLKEQEAFRQRYSRSLKEALEKTQKGELVSEIDAYQTGDWKEFDKGYSFTPVKTAVPADTLGRIAERLTAVPEAFQIHPKLKRILEDRKKRYTEGTGLDWASAEALSFGSLLIDGFPIRLSGEDSSRGTFSQRHAVWWDVSTPVPKSFISLNHIDAGQAMLSVYDSPLSEFSVLGFEYGYALSQPKSLVIWEAQFGDFANGAQVIIDQFIAAGESKWFRSNGLVMLLPHGFEGQGPEHSSAHLERFLQLCAEDNMQVCNLTTPGQYFHVLRRQMLRRFRLPLIVMAPKSLLRNELAVSSMKDLATGSFHEVLDDPKSPTRARTMIFCTGKVYYDIEQRREEMGETEGTGIIRIEQLYPFPELRIKQILRRYGDLSSFLWVQEEPKNRGAWNFIRDPLESVLGGAELRYIGRKASASPATGSYSQHRAEREAILKESFSKENFS